MRLLAAAVALAAAAAAVSAAAAAAVQAAGLNLTTHACMLPNVTGLPFCNSSLPLSDRASDLVSRLTVVEKVCLSISTANCGVPRLGLPAYNWGVEDLHGAGTQCLTDAATGATHCPTIFPILANLAAGFNETAWEGVGTVIGSEMRVVNNFGGTRYRHPASNQPVGVNGWGPNLNIARDPRWGRNSEVPSECPFLSGKVGAAMTRGIQGKRTAWTPAHVSEQADSEYLLLLGAIKHVTAYSLENWLDDTGGPRNGTKYTRFGFNANISRHDLAEIYLEQMRIAIAESSPRGMMCSYAAINGSASCENGALLTTWARKSTGFVGNVVTDCGALAMSSEPADPAISAAAALNAGTDLNCGKTFEKGLANAIASNYTTIGQLDISLQRSIILLMEAGYFDRPELIPYSALGLNDMGSNSSHLLAREVAAQGLVLLRNERHALPLKAGKKTAVIGPMSNATLGLLNRYWDAACPGTLDPTHRWGHGMRPAGCIRSPLLRIAARLDPSLVTFESGVVCPEDFPASHCLQSTNTSNMAPAFRAAAEADQIVVVLGTDENDENEGTDRQRLSLSGIQEKLLAGVRAAASLDTPVVLVLIHGGAIAVNYTLADAAVDAFSPGIEGGEAIACALFGEPGCNRWGRLPVTIYPTTFEKNDMANMGVSTGGSGLRTYRYYDNGFGPPLFEFGFGLSLVNFSIAWATNSTTPATPPNVVTGGAPVRMTVTTQNMGDREGDNVVLVYHYPRTHASSFRRSALGAALLPQRRLVAFKRVSLQAGAAANVTFEVTAADLALVDSNGDTLLVEGHHELRVSQGDGIAAHDLQRTFNVPPGAGTVLRRLEWYEPSILE